NQPKSPIATAMVMRATHVASASVGACTIAVHSTTASITHDIAARNDTSPAPALSAAARRRIERRDPRRASFWWCGVWVMSFSSRNHEARHGVDHEVDRHLHGLLALRGRIMVHVGIGEPVADVGFIVIEQHEAAINGHTEGLRRLAVVLVNLG